MTSILLVCRANVCRSHYASGLLEHWMTVKGVTGLSIASAGTNALLESARCSTVEDRLTMLEPISGVKLLPKSGPRLIDRGLISSADLILTLGVSHRSRVVSLDPAARRRTFTLKEASVFSESVSENGPQGEDLDLERVVDHMNRLRGLISVPSTPSPWWRPLQRRLPADPSISDGHAGGPRAHNKTLDEVAATTAHLTTALDRLLVHGRT